MATAAYKRIMLKLNGEALAGGAGWGIDVPTVESIAAQIQRVQLGPQVLFDRLAEERIVPVVRVVRVPGPIHPACESLQRSHRILTRPQSAPIRSGKSAASWGAGPAALGR